MAVNLFNSVTEQLNRTDVSQTVGMPDIPEAVRLFLGQLSLLKGVPLYYLLPDERYLPKTIVSTIVDGIEEPVEKGSIRLFRLDKEWIECLLDGALSVGHDEDRQLLMAKAMSGNYTAEVFYNDTKEKIKKQLYGLYTPEDHVLELNKRLFNKNISFADTGQPKINGKLTDNGQPEPTVAQNNWRYTGFFMRSTLISSWVGVEIIAEGKATDDKGRITDDIIPLQVVRFERIATDTIFCICEGMISMVQITQPSETVHFGVEEKEGVYKAAGETITFRNPGSMIKGVLDITELKKNLGVKDSANFADKMLSKPMKVTIDINWNIEKPII